MHLLGFSLDASQTLLECEQYPPESTLDAVMSLIDSMLESQQNEEENDDFYENEEEQKEEKEEEE